MAIGIRHYTLFSATARHAFLFAVIGSAVAFVTFPVCAQSPEPTATPVVDTTPVADTTPALDMSRTAAPPPKELTKDEKDQLTLNASDLKKFTKVALDLMESRMKRAEEADARDDFDTMFKELGAFHALIDQSLDLILKRHNSGKKAFSEFKRYELGVRGFIPRMELIRRDLPIRYEYYIRILIKHLREAREKAIDPMFADSVVKDRS